MNTKPKLKRIFLSPPHMGGEEMRFIEQAFESNYLATLRPLPISALSCYVTAVNLNPNL